MPDGGRRGQDGRQRAAGQRRQELTRISGRVVPHQRAQEPGRPAQVLRLADVQDVVAREPVQRTAIPVLPQHFGLFGRGQAVTEAGDDQPTVLGHQRLVVQRAVVGRCGGGILATHAAECTAEGNQLVGGPPLVERRLGGDHRDVGDHRLESVVDRGDQRRGVAAQRHSGQRDPVDAGVAQDSPAPSGSRARPGPSSRRTRPCPGRRIRNR